jgi:hypothetical protein
MPGTTLTDATTDSSGKSPTYPLRWLKIYRPVTTLPNR